MNRLEKLVINLWDLEERLVRRLNKTENLGGDLGPVCQPSSLVRCTHEDNGFRVAEHIPEVWLGVVARDQYGFLANQATQAMSNEYEGTVRCVADLSAGLKIIQKVRGMIDKPVCRRNRLLCYVRIVAEREDASLLELRW